MDMNNKVFCSIVGFLGAFAYFLFGGWSVELSTLVIFMGIDFVTGLLVAGVFNKSEKSETGAIKSNLVWKGIFKKFMSICIVVVAYRIDVLINTSYVKEAVVIAFITNEAVSIIENAGLMGVPLPAKLKSAIEILRK